MLTRAAAQALAGASQVWLRTGSHPSARSVPEGIDVRTCDDIYERLDDFESVYGAIAMRIVDAALEGPVVYAVPGDPAVGETSVRFLRAEAARRGYPVAEIPGVPFLSPVLAALGWDAIDGLQIADATSLAARHHPDLDPDRPALVAQVYSRMVASDLKLVLLAQYPAEHVVTLVVAGSDDQPGAAGDGPGVTARSVSVPLSELDRADVFDDLTTLAVPPLAEAVSLHSLAEVVAHLRAPDGCPWDREQTHASLRPYVIEEAYEVLEALDAVAECESLEVVDHPRSEARPGSGAGSGPHSDLAEELGDLLLQVVLHAQIASEEGSFQLADVVGSIRDKLMRRHPHVFGDVRADTADEVRANWDALKAAEKADKGAGTGGAASDGLFEGIPSALPALARAQAAVRRAAAAGVELGDLESPEAATVSSPPSSPASREAAVGAMLWSAARMASEWGVDAESALRARTARYMQAARTPAATDHGFATDAPGMPDTDAAVPAVEDAKVDSGPASAGAGDGPDTARGGRTARHGASKET